ncbi:MAG: hypothetical protein H6694_07855, partial [Candidatus Latescibacteria bacterium]|nr:hypothetical protein [Candidatus Latescibacterota bacterium]
MQASITALVLLAALAAPGRAATYYMLPDSTGAFTTLQEAVDACVDGDSVVLADGTFYIENPLGVIFWGKNIFFGSASDSPEDCVIDVAAGESGYKFGFNLSQGETRDCVVQGVTVCNGRGHDGGAIHIRGNSNPTVRNCILRDNYSVAGGGGLKAYELS